ncbi:D-alanyl-lipoteichoic acid biosynthesis protein DltD [uncultured Granulicatella sp.]|uniref:D-alanyl-lipoteichoic acid biosynthesis protein DltD n=1 Tax=uncultured Granulicatella sp. TaxID=316089 RepID=UPI0028D79D3B|nr:D-alanyl-lipoteichoic acid biosynthesis protein DltD [uncultured Granulicatella sp.]
MKKIQAFGIALVLALLTLALYLHIINQKLANYYHVSDNSIRYNFEFTKYKGRDILKDNIDDKTLVVLGSSELGKVSEHPFHIKQLFNYDDFHIMAIGGGNFQNIIQASMLGSLGNDFPKQKFILSESFIWFDQFGMNPKAFLSRVSNEHVYYTLINPKISKETKEKFMKRVLELSKDNKNVHETFERYKRRLVDHKGTIVDDWLIKIDVEKFALNNKISFYFTGNVTPIPSSGPVTPNYDWKELQNKYLNDAKVRTEGNDFGIEKRYYASEIQNRLEKLKNSAAKYKYDISTEYDDYALVLQMAKEMGLEVEVVNFPINGKWYDYIGIGPEQRAIYSKKITEITESFGYKIMDLTSKEYEPYYMYDTVHPGWKGWPEVAEEMLKFYQKN